MGPYREIMSSVLRTHVSGDIEMRQMPASTARPFQSPAAYHE